MRLYDIHAHLADERVHGQIDDVLSESVANGVAGVLACAAQCADWRPIIELCGRPGV